MEPGVKACWAVHRTRGTSTGVIVYGGLVGTELAARPCCSPAVGCAALGPRYALILRVLPLEVRTSEPVAAVGRSTRSVRGTFHSIRTLISNHSGNSDILVLHRCYSCSIDDSNT